jgi:hypothetical protein
VATSGFSGAREIRDTSGMGLKNLFSRWSKGSDEDAIERAEEQSRMTASERELDQAESFVGRQTDSFISNSWAGSEAIRSTDDFDRDRI